MFASSDCDIVEIYQTNGKATSWHYTIGETRKTLKKRRQDKVKKKGDIIVPFSKVILLFLFSTKRYGFSQPHLKNKVPKKITSMYIMQIIESLNYSNCYTITFICYCDIQLLISKVCNDTNETNLATK